MKIPLADLGGMPSARPLWDPILSFLHTFSPKSTHVGGPHPPNGYMPPPMGNPGSATGYTTNSFNHAMCASINNMKKHLQFIKYERITYELPAIAVLLICLNTFGRHWVVKGSNLLTNNKFILINHDKWTLTCYVSILQFNSLILIFQGFFFQIYTWEIVYAK